MMKNLLGWTLSWNKLWYLGWFGPLGQSRVHEVKKTAEGGGRCQKWWKFANILDGWSLTRILVFEKQRLTKFALVWTVLTTQLTLKAKLRISGNRDSKNCVMGGLCADFFQDLPAFSNSAQICMLCNTLIEILESKLFLDFYIMTVILKFLLPPPCKSETQKWVSVFIKVLIVIELLHMWRYTLQLHTVKSQAVDCLG